MKTLFEKLTKILLLLLISLSFSCGDDDDDDDMTSSCEGELVSSCLTNGSTKTWRPVLAGDNEITDDCVLSIRLTFRADNTFDFSSNQNCAETDDYSGTWALQSNNTKIVITPGWFENETSTFEILSLTSVSMLAITPTVVGLENITWRRI